MRHSLLLKLGSEWRGFQQHPLPKDEATSSVEVGASDGEDLSNTIFLEVRQPFRLRLGQVMERN